MITTVGDPNVWPAGIRTPTGTDPRNATTEAAICRDTADAVAWLRAHSVDRMHATMGDLQAVTNATPGEAHHVSGYGWYWYTASALALQTPYVMTASGMGGGRWVSDALYALLETATDGTLRLKRALQQHYTWHSGTCFAGTMLDTGTIAAGGSYLDTTHYVEIPNCVEGDILSGVFGPLLVVTPGTTNPGSRGRIDVELVSGYGAGTGSTAVIRNVAAGTLGGYMHVHEISWRGDVTIPGTALVRMRFTAPDDVTLVAQCRDSYFFGQYRAERP
jgi:hypothetical protein